MSHSPEIHQPIIKLSINPAELQFRGVSKTLIGICSSDSEWVHLIGLFSMCLTYVACAFCDWWTGVSGSVHHGLLLPKRLLTNDSLAGYCFTVPYREGSWLWEQCAFSFSVLPDDIMGTQRLSSQRPHRNMMWAPACDTGTVLSLCLCNNFYWPGGDRHFVRTWTGLWHLSVTGKK